MYNENYIKAKEILAKRKSASHDQNEARTPPGQVITQRFPILDLGIKPVFDPKTWRLRVYGLVVERFFSYEEILNMPRTEFTEDFHCVTRWSKQDVKWAGVLFSEFIKIIKPREEWKFLIQEGMEGYTANVSREDLSNALLAYELEGKPLPTEHGAPLRIIIPHLYAWKGSKFLKGLKFTDKDEPGFWEVRGYHSRGNAWKEERYS